MQRAIEAAKAAGAKRAVMLPVSVPSHSEPDARRGRAPGARAWRASERPPARDPLHQRGGCHGARRPGRPARSCWCGSSSSPVRWPDTLRAVAAAGIAQVIECGPGKVLTGLNRRIEKRADLEFLALEDPAALDAALAATTRESAHA